MKLTYTTALFTLLNCVYKGMEEGEPHSTRLELKTTKKLVLRKPHSHRTRCKTMRWIQILTEVKISITYKWRIQTLAELILDNPGVSVIGW